MEFNFGEDQLLLQETVRDFLAGECPVEFIRAQWETETGRCPEFWSKLSEIGVPGLLIAEDQGGLGMNEIDSVRVFEEIGRADPGRRRVRSAPTQSKRAWSTGRSRVATRASRPRPSAAGTAGATARRPWAVARRREFLDHEREHQM